MKSGSPHYRIGIIGATGYTGVELARLLHRHPNVRIHLATSESFAGRTLDAIYPTAPALQLIKSDDAGLEELDVAFLCLPHGAAAETAKKALNAGARVIDLSADFRLKTQALYERTYDVAHPAPELLREAVYGLTEHCRAALPDARLVANPGCYPTTVLLGLAPLLRMGVLPAGTVAVDAKSGASGAGRSPSRTTHFCEVADNLSPYKVGRAHRHLPEMEQELAEILAPGPELLFTPHLLPIPRGMLSCIYVPLAVGQDEAMVRAAYEEAYRNEPFVRLLPEGEIATIGHAVNTNRAAISLTFAGRSLIVISAIDNLLKGASGQAVQNMNVMLGLEETLGLE